MSKDAKRTTVTLPEEIHAQMAAVAGEKKQSLNDCFIQAVTDWLNTIKFQKKGPDIQDMSELWPGLANRLSNPFQLMAAAWRTERARRQSQAISTHKLSLDAFPADIYLMRIIEEMMRDLDEQDLFCTVTNFRFWTRIDSYGRVEEDHPYLRAQETAVRKGMQVRRVFILCEDDFETEDLMSLKKPLKEELLRQISFQKRMDDRYRNKVRTTYLNLHRVKLQDVMMRYGHFALIRRGVKADGQDEHCVVVEPIYIEGRISRLDFIFSRGPGNQDPDTMFYIRRFEEATANNPTISKLATDLGIDVP